MKTINSDMGHVEIDEYDIHTMLTRRSFITNELDNIHQVTVVSTTPTFDTAKWQKKMTDLIEMIGDLDCEIHDDAEYTCDGFDQAPEPPDPDDEGQIPAKITKESYYLDNRDSHMTELHMAYNGGSGPIIVEVEPFELMTNAIENSIVSANIKDALLKTLNMIKDILDLEETAVIDADMAAQPQEPK